MEMPNATQITAALATLGMVLQYFGYTAPNANRADANREANFMARDQLAQCFKEREKLLDRLLEDHE